LEDLMIDRLTAAHIAVVAYVTTGLERLRDEDRNRGVVSIEYIVLGAAVITLIGVLSNNGEVQDALKNAFTKLFNDAG
jgi:Flp pilus assembly pilin Flp